MNKTIGFIGLGNMGKPMAQNLIKAGFELIVFDLSKKAMDELCAAGAKIADSVKSTAEASDILITILPADKEILEVYTKEDGVINHIRNGSICIEMTSALGDTVKEIDRLSKDLRKEITFIDAPVSGGIAGAQGGTLTIMVGGEKNKIEECRPILQVMGDKIIYAGDLGSGKAVKMVNQFLNAGNTYIASEALFLAKHLNLDMDILCSIINESTGGSWVFKNNVPKVMIPQNFEQGFRLDLMKKDIGLSMLQAQSDNLSLPVMSLIYQIYQAMMNQGNKNKNYNVVSQWIEQQNEISKG
ncbi:MAG TPA: NAD(P)-dependent oxidoreductase [Clostridia bacterium]